MYEFRFADIGEGIHEGQVLKWMFKEGDEVHDGDTLCVIETDKVNAEIPSPVDGTLKRLGAKVGEIIHVGEILAVIDDGSETTTSEEPTKKVDEKEPVNEGEEGSAGVVGELEVSSEVIESSDEGHQKENTKSDKKVLATPVARKLAKDLGIDINTVKGTGQVGRVMKEDIYQASERKEEGTQVKKPVAPSIEVKSDQLVERVPLTKLRKTIAKNMTLSKSIIPHASTMDEFDVTKLVEFRKAQKPVAEKQNINLTYMPFIIKAITIALKEFPMFNASYDHEKEEMIYKKFYNIGMAVDTEDGLIVPVIKNADQKSILSIAKEIENLKDQSKDRRLSMDQLQDGTFTITNYGAFGSTYGVPVIKYPEVAIIGIGKIAKKPVVLENEIVIRDLVPISLSIDHRVIDGGDAGRFLMRLKELLQDPMLLLLS